MAFKDLVERIKRNSIEGMRKDAVKQARAQYNPNVMNAALDNAAYQAEFGIADDAMRARAVDATYRGVDSDTVDLAGGNAALAMASQEAQNISRSERLANTMLGIDVEEERAILEGRASYADIMTKKNELTAQRDAAIHGASVQATAAKKQRNMQLLQTAVGIAGIAATAGAGAAAGGAGAAAKGASGAKGALSFLNTGLGTMNNLQNQRITYSRSNLDRNVQEGFNPVAYTLNNLGTSPSPEVQPPNIGELFEIYGGRRI